MANTWQGLADEIEGKIQELTESGEFNVQSVTDLDGISHTFYSIDDMITWWERVKGLAETQDETPSRTPYRPMAFRRSSFRR